MYNIIPVTALKRFRLHAFFISKKQRQAKIGKKNQANAKQHPEGEILLFENYSHSSSTLSSKNNRTYSENKENNMYLYIPVYIPEIIRSMTMKIKVKMKNKPRPRHG